MPAPHVRSAIRRYEMGQEVLIVCRNASELSLTMKDVSMGSTWAMVQEENRLRAATARRGVIHFVQMNDFAALTDIRANVEHVYYPVMSNTGELSYMELSDEEFYSTYVHRMSAGSVPTQPRTSKPKAKVAATPVDAFDVLNGDDLI